MSKLSLILVFINNKMNQFPDFPLYEQIVSRVSNDVLQSSEKQAVISAIKSMTDDEHEIVFALVRAYQLNFDTNPVQIIPYEGKSYKSKNIKFDLNELPTKLQQVLYAFVHICQQSKL